MTTRQAIEKTLAEYGIKDVRNKTTPLNDIIRFGMGRKREAFLAACGELGIKHGRKIWDDVRVSRTT